MTSGIAGRKIVLLGGAGFIGHHLALELAERGADVHIIDSLQVNNAWAIYDHGPYRDLHLRIVNERLDLLRSADIPFSVQDARDYHALAHLLGEIRPDVLLHAAAVAHTNRSNKDPFSTFDHSLRTLENALDYARGNVEHFIFLSSSMVYGNFLTPQVDEEHPQNSIGIYGALKAAGEKIVIAYEQVFGVPYTIVRPSALYGPRCISRRVVQVFVENALSGRPLQMRGDGSSRLDFTYIEDLVQGLCRVIESPAALNEVFNITNGEARSVADLIEVLRGEFPELNIEEAEPEELMPERGTLSTDKACRLLGYDPQNPIEIGVPKYVTWYRELVGSLAYR